VHGRIPRVQSCDALYACIDGLCVQCDVQKGRYLAAAPVPAFALLQEHALCAPLPQCIVLWSRASGGGELQELFVWSNKLESVLTKAYYAHNQSFNFYVTSRHPHSNGLMEP